MGPPAGWRRCPGPIPLVSDPPVLAPVRRGGGPRDAVHHRRRLHRHVDGGMGVLVATATGDRPLVPAQPHHGLRGPGVHGGGGGLRPGARRGAGP